MAGGLCEKGREIAVKARGGGLTVHYTDEPVILTGDVGLVYTGEAEY